PTFPRAHSRTVRLATPGAVRPAVGCSSLWDAPRPDSSRLPIKRIGPRSGEPPAKAGLVSSHFHDLLTAGDRIEVKAPAGEFTVDQTRPDRPVVLIAGGIGITPLLSMVNGIAAAKSPRQTWLLYGVRDDREHIMRGHLETLARANANLHLHVFYSRPAAPPDSPDIHVGHIDLDALKRLLPSNAYDFYVCGPAAMMESVTRDLQAWEVPTDRVHMEAFGPATGRQALHGPTD